MKEIKTHRPHSMGESKLTCDPKGTMISEDAYFDITGNITIKDHVRIADGVKIFTHKHDWKHSKENRHVCNKRTRHDIVIDSDAFVGANAILYGISRVGKGALIGCGSVVTKDVNDYEIVVGNPAKVIGIRGEYSCKG